MILSDPKYFIKLEYPVEDILRILVKN